MTTPLALHLLKGALTSPTKRGPYAGARLPQDTLTLPAAAPGPEHVRRYARVCGHDPRADTLPPAYPHVMAFPLATRLMARRDFPFPLLGLVHTRIELTQQRPLARTERIGLSVHTENPAAHRRGTTFDVVTRAESDGEVVWHSRSTYLCRHSGSTPDAEPRRSAPPQDAPREDARGEDARPQSPEPLPAGETWSLPAGLGRRYAAASGDRNPIHLHALTARALGFPRALAHGMWTFARCLAAHEADSGGRADGIGFAEADFRAPVFLPARVAHAADQDTGAFELRGTGERPRLHLTGRVSASTASHGETATRSA
ncbi:MaoC family dehydratase [Streptomyces diacarni]|uniref:MaoC family dehydratase n=1 Tax=Streptomyces diacarni TaxID=2800381 RepID=UPI0033F1E759